MIRAALTVEDAAKVLERELKLAEAIKAVEGDQAHRIIAKDVEASAFGIEGDG